jgi:hypothetical protein
MPRPKPLTATQRRDMIDLLERFILFCNTQSAIDGADLASRKHFLQARVAWWKGAVAVDSRKPKPIIPWEIYREMTCEDGEQTARTNLDALREIEAAA